MVREVNVVMLINEKLLRRCENERADSLFMERLAPPRPSI